GGRDGGLGGGVVVGRHGGPGTGGSGGSGGNGGSSPGGALFSTRGAGLAVGPPPWAQKGSPPSRTTHLLPGHQGHSRPTGGRRPRRRCLWGLGRHPEWDRGQRPARRSRS